MSWLAHSKTILGVPSVKDCMNTCASGRHDPSVSSQKGVMNEVTLVVGIGSFKKTSGPLANMSSASAFTYILLKVWPKNGMLNGKLMGPAHASSTFESGCITVPVWLMSTKLKLGPPASRSDSTV